jgi:hypothetical protein
MWWRWPYTGSEPLKTLPSVGDFLYSGELDEQYNLTFRTYQVRRVKGKNLVLERDDGVLVEETAKSTKLRPTEKAIAGELVSQLQVHIQFHEKEWSERIQRDIKSSQSAIARNKRSLITERPEHERAAAALREAITRLTKLFHLEET